MPLRVPSPLRPPPALGARGSTCASCADAASPVPTLPRRHDVRRRREHVAHMRHSDRDRPLSGLQGPRAEAGECSAAPARQRVRLYAKPKKRMPRVDGAEGPGTTAAAAADVVLVASALIVDGQGNVLITRRPPGKRYAGFWEFPGGKVAARETPEAALARELSEEICLQVSPDTLEKVAFATDCLPTKGKHLVMLLYCVDEWQGEPRGAEEQDLLWVAASALAGVEFTEMHKSLARLALGYLDTRKLRSGAAALGGAVPRGVANSSESVLAEAALPLRAEAAGAGGSAGG